MSLTNKTNKHVSKTTRNIDNAAARAGEVCANKLSLVIDPLSEKQQEASEKQLAAIAKSKEEILGKVDSAKDQVKGSLKETENKIIEASKENTKVISKRLESLEGTIVTLKEGQRANLATIRMLKGELIDARSIGDLLIASANNFKDGDMTTKDKDTFINHTLHDIDTLAALFAKQDQAAADAKAAKAAKEEKKKQQKANKAGKTLKDALNKTFGGKN